VLAGTPMILDASPIFKEVLVCKVLCIDVPSAFEASLFKGLD
jgi:hypothetical protein